MEEEMLEKLESLEPELRNQAELFFTRQSLLDNVYDLVRRKYAMQITHFGSPNSKVIFFVDFENTNDDVLMLMKAFFDQNKLDFYSSIFVNVNKTDNKAMNEKIILKELEIIRPKRVVCLGDFDIKIPDTISYKSISNKDLKNIIDKRTHKKEIDQKVFKDSVDKLIKVISFAFFKSK